MNQSNKSILQKLKQFFIGKAKDIQDKSLFRHISLVAFLAWVGLGGDCLTSSCYGPPEAFAILGHHQHLCIIIGVLTTITIFVIAAGYNLIIELFPEGGGGYFVAGRLLSPKLGMVSGSALVLDYVLVITLSIASGTDAIFSLLPNQYGTIKLVFSLFIIFILIILNLRGIKESVMTLLPIFLLFLITHTFAIIYAISTKFSDLQTISTQFVHDYQKSNTELGSIGLFILILKSFSMGAGTYTGIEAVSNGMPILREPKIKTARKTMAYMAFSLSFMVLGLMISFLIYKVRLVHGKTLNAVLFEAMTQDWSSMGTLFVFVILFSEASLLYVAAQTGFLDGPRVLSNMATDKWLPTSFSMLSDRLVTRKGILLMGILASIIMLISHQSVKFLIILFSINVFITFTLSQLGMTKHWWEQRNSDKKWIRKILINGTSFIVCAMILTMVIAIKFHEGGWITMFITGLLICFALYVKRHYNRTEKKLAKLNTLIKTADNKIEETLHNITHKMQGETKGCAMNKTAVILVSGFNGSGITSLLNALQLFDGGFKNFIFVEIGILNTKTLRSQEIIHQMDEEVKSELKHYVRLVERHGFKGKAIRTLGTDVSEEALKIAPTILEKYPDSIFFGGQLLFPKDTIFTRYLHNYAAFSLQKNFYERGIPFIVLPIDIR